MEHDLVKVTWADANHMQSTASIEEVEKHKLPLETSVGFRVVSEFPEIIALAQTVRSDGDLCDVLFIPKCTVQSYDILTEAETEATELDSIAKPVGRTY